MATDSMRHPLLAMNKIVLGMSLLTCLTVSLYSQERPPQLLFHAAQCLTAKKFLPPSKAANLTLGFLLDEKSYPGDKVVYVVEYATPARSGGLVFAVFLTDRDGRQNFNIQNNASFVLSKEELSGVSFLDPPLGGEWTQRHLASAIKQIGRQPKFAIHVKELSSVEASITCEAYTDPQAKAGVR